MKIFMQNFWYAVNYGANLTALSLYYSLKKNNDVSYIDNMTPKDKIIYCSSYVKDFTNKLCNVSSLHSEAKGTYITGSDQVFNPNCEPDHIRENLLDYVSSENKKIAVSASFGVDKERFIKENSLSTIKKMAQSLKSFDYISVREKSGVQICKEIFNVNAEWIIDPVFFQDVTFWNNLAEASNKQFNNKIVSYILNENLNCVKAYKFLEKKYDSEVVRLSDFIDSPETWLNAIKTCKLLVTDSFHGTCFALIFNKPFICIVNSARGSARYDSVFELLNVRNQCILSIDEIYQKDCIFDINWNSVNTNIIYQRERGLSFINKALSSTSQKKREKQEVFIDYLESIKNTDGLVLKSKDYGFFEKKIKSFIWRLRKIYFRKFIPKFFRLKIKMLLIHLFD